MNYIVTPEFNRKTASLPMEGRAAISFIIDFVQSTEKDAFTAGGEGIEVRALESEIFTVKHGDYRVYGSFGENDDGEYFLLLDVVLETSYGTGGRRLFATHDPRSNPTLDPNRNQTIDPRRNMTIDPRRNMTIDPRRNMTIDPRRNMTIDPRRNMTIDPRRNMTIDPRRNMTIDPNRNMAIDPRRNRFYGGPYVYTPELEQEGFVVRANDKVSLLFDLSANFAGFYVGTSTGNSNIFDVSGVWQGFLVTTNQAVLLRFDPDGSWSGLIV